MIYEKGVVGEGKFVLTGDLLVARNRLAFVAEEMGFTISKALRRKLQHALIAREIPGWSSNLYAALGSSIYLALDLA